MAKIDSGPRLLQRIHVDVVAAYVNLEALGHDHAGVAMFAGVVVFFMHAAVTDDHVFFEAGRDGIRTK